jgi:uncharacterized membrane protein YdjX (TVP38/TMEM64 family)
VPAWPADGGAGRRGGLLVAGLLLLAALAVTATFLPWESWITCGREVVEGWGAWGPFAFALVYAVLVVGLVPGSPLTFLAGAAFGLPVAVFAVYGGALMGSTVALLLARGALRPRVESWIAGHPRLAALDALFHHRGASVAFLLRLTPALPFSLLNYALGLTRLSVKASLLASPAMLPGIFLFTSLGAAAGAAAEGAPHQGARLALLGLGALAALALSLWLGRVAARATAPPPPP